MCKGVVQRYKDMQIQRNALMSVGVLGLLALLLMSSIQVLAYTDLKAGQPMQPNSHRDYNVVTTQPGSYVPAVNTYTDGNPSYYLVTNDPNRVGTNAIEYQGAVYPISNVVLVDGTNNATVKADPADTRGFFHFASPGNRTFFFDPGVYHDPVFHNYTTFDRPNSAYIGLGTDANGDPAAVFTKASRNAGSGITEIERYTWSQPNICIENITFDGQGHSMVPMRNHAGKRHRGEYLHFITGADDSYTRSNGFVMRNVLTKNVGQTGGMQFADVFNPRKNVAINVYRHRGQVHLENLRFRNVKTQGLVSGLGASDGGFGVVQTNQARGLYLSNLQFEDQGGMDPGASPIKIETMMKRQDAMSLYENNVVFDGHILFDAGPQGQRDYVYVEDYRYHSVHLPASFRYVQYAKKNGNDERSAGRAYQYLPPAKEGHAILDLQDHSYLIQQGLPGLSVDQQMADALAVVQAGNQGETGDRNLPPANLKLVTFGQPIQSFTIQAQASVLGPAYPIQVVAVQALDSPVSSTALVDVAPDALFQIGTVGNQTVLHNFNFDQLAKATVEHAIMGVSATAPVTDPYDAAGIPGYPSYASYAEVLNPHVLGINGVDVASHPEPFFRNARFTTLIEAITFSVESPQAVGVGQTVQLIVQKTKAYTGLVEPTVHEIDDQTLHYYSTDPSVASVDLLTGELTGHQEGPVTILVKAVDQFNRGEKEKPWLHFTIEVQAAPVETQPTQPTQPDEPEYIPTPTFPVAPIPTFYVPSPTPPIYPGPTLAFAPPARPVVTEAPLATLPRIEGSAVDAVRQLPATGTAKRLWPWSFLGLGLWILGKKKAG